MNYNEFFASVKDNHIRGCYLFEGTEEYIKQQALKRLEEKLLPSGLEEMNLTLLNNPDANALISACDTLPFMAEKRLVVINECASLTSAKKSDSDDTAEAIAEYLTRPSPDSCIVFYVKGKADSRKKLYKALAKCAAIVDFSPMNAQESAKWCMKTLKSRGKEVPQSVADYLVFTVGTDAALLTQEMEKLLSYTEGQPTIENADIDAICTRSLECNVFMMVDAQVEGNMNKALTFLSEMLRNGEEGMMIMAMLLRQYRILYHMRCLIEEKASPAQMPAILGIPPFSVSRTQHQAKSFSIERLKKAYDYLMNQEYLIKQGKLPQNGCAETALAGLELILRH